MDKFNALELLGNKVIEFNIYNQDGDLLLKAGDVITPSIIMQFKYKDLYHDRIQCKYKAPEDSHIQSLISKEATSKLLNSTKKILELVFDDKSPEASVCEGVRDQILDEVSENLDKIDCIGQLRIFDEYTYSHAVNVSSMCSAMAMTIGMTEKEVEHIALGGLLHDIGKMKIPIEILHKPGKLTEEEFEIIKNHSMFGYSFLKEEMNMPEEIAIIALQHQEKYGGFGYPSNLKAEEISKPAQIASIVDVYDALVSTRPYKKAMPSHEAIRILIKDGSKAFNPSLLYKFIYLANYKDSTNVVIS